MKKLMTVALLACGLAACGGGTTVQGPTEVAQAPEPVAQAPQPAATPKPIDAPAPVGLPFEVTFGNAPSFSVKHTGSGTAHVQSFLTTFDNQTAAIPGTLRDYYVAGGDTALGAYEGATCVQLDVDAPGQKLISAAFYDKEGKRFKTSDSDAGVKIEACRCTPTWNRSEQFETIYGAWVINGCSKSRTVTRRYTETQTCTNETRTVDIVVEPQVEANALAASYTLGALSYPTYTPELKVGGYLFGNNSNGNRDACEDHGGVWHHSLKFCQISKLFGDTWRDDEDNLSGDHTPQSDGAWQSAFTIQQASGGNPISGSAQIANAGTYKLVLKATDPGNYDKDIDTKTLVCGQSATLNVDYSWIGHSSDDWFLQLYLNNVLVATSPVVNNPSN